MRTYGPLVSAHLAARKPIVSRNLVWITAKDRISGNPVTLGMSNMDIGATFTINGSSRDYSGAGTLLKMESLQADTGLAVRIHQIRLSLLSDEVSNAIRLYDARLAPVEIHRALFDPVTRVLLEEPHKVFNGWANTLEITIADSEGISESECILSLASNSRALTKPLTLKKSDASQKLRGADDLFSYSSISAAVPVRWGQ
jgi:hypothetical protein